MAHDLLRRVVGNTKAHGGGGACGACTLVSGTTWVFFGLRAFR